MKLGYSSLDIVTDRNKVPEIWYEKDGKKKRYFCDIYIPNENRIIEIKSDYTYSHKSGNVQDKAQATIDMGFDYEIWIYDKDTNKTIIKYKPS